MEIDKIKLDIVLFPVRFSHLKRDISLPARSETAWC